MSRARFARGTGCFACECCGRQTRDTGAVAVGVKMCEQCWDAAGIENEYQDEVITEDQAREQLIALRDLVVAKGGDAQAFQDSIMIDLSKPSAAVPAHTPDEDNTMKTYTNKSNAARAGKAMNNGTLDGLELKGKEGAWYYDRPAAAHTHGPAKKAVTKKAVTKTAAPAKKAVAKKVPAKKAVKKAAPRKAVEVVEYDVKHGPTQGRITGYHIDQDRPTKHGIKRRSAGTIGGRLWALFDKLAAKAGGAKDVLIADVKAHKEVDGIFNTNKVLIEFYIWRRYNGVRGRGKKQKVS